MASPGYGVTPGVGLRDRCGKRRKTSAITPVAETAAAPVTSVSAFAPFAGGISSCGTEASPAAAASQPLIAPVDASCQVSLEDLELENAVLRKEVEELKRKFASVPTSHPGPAVAEAESLMTGGDAQTLESFWADVKTETTAAANVKPLCDASTTFAPSSQHSTFAEQPEAVPPAMPTIVTVAPDVASVTSTSRLATTSHFPAVPLNHQALARQRRRPRVKKGEVAITGASSRASSPSQSDSSSSSTSSPRQKRDKMSKRASAQRGTGGRDIDKQIAKRTTNSLTSAGFSGSGPRKQRSGRATAVAKSAQSTPPEASDSAKATATRDDVFAGRRTVFREKLCEALGGDEFAVRYAEGADAALFNSFSQSASYHRQARALLFNLRGGVGTEFRMAIRAGVFPAESLPKLQTEDMAPSSKKLERSLVRREAMEACESDWDLRRERIVMNGMFTCGKCHGNRTWYFQFQTRACDEPMEFFVMCRDCCHGWRHNEDSPDDIFRQVWST
eukprot:TRINITY_DN70216_c0_g1_i1.p1 TRINITY_DN70216_c0_g1~~TRINITY_DN70216_c0_g1_i1.p1  ORF type:complete len:504 (-),score=67.55 TRINITY_DN70216_c0_g1_i1:278-1789(-)